MKKTLPLNPAPNGTARAIKAQYWKTSFANFLRTGFAGNIWSKDGISPALMTMQGGG